MSGAEDADNYKRRYGGPYNPKHKIPTVQEYRSKKSQQQAELASDKSSKTHTSWSQQAWNYWYGSPSQEHDGKSSSQYSQGNDGDEDAGGRHDAATDQYGRLVDGQNGTDQSDEETSNDKDEQGRPGTEAKKDTTQSAPVPSPKAKRKQMKHKRRDRIEREVTDPVTHLPVTIYDFTDKDLKELDDDSEDGEISHEQKPKDDGSPNNYKSLANKGRTTTGSSTLDEAHSDIQRKHRGIQQTFPPPDFDMIKIQMARVYRWGFVNTSLAVVALIVVDWLAYVSFGHVSLFERNSKLNRISNSAIYGFIPLFFGVGIISVAHTWIHNKIQQVWDDEIWFAQRRSSTHPQDAELPESTQWFNMLLKSIWPLVNPELFGGVADTLEDVMQASLPSMVRMISVEDIGQGSEPLRILGIRWLPKGAAGRSVDVDGKIESQKDKRIRENKANDKNGPSNDGQQKKSDGDQADEEVQQQDNVAEGLQAEEGDFINLELGFAYRANKSRPKFRDRARNAHLLLAFYLPGNIKLPVWVELRGLVGSLRARMQITPDPPFLALCTLTLLGQPKVDLSCVPLVRRGLNIMDLPLLSNFVQGAINAAMSEYVAPKSLILDLKSMLAGDDFKKDTSARGILVVNIKRAFDFKEGDMSIPMIKEGKSDAYVSVGWAKFGKPLWSTRVIIDDMEPYWQEETFLLVGPEELDADENLRVQLWDSDRFTADDDLGRVELSLKDLMKNKKSDGKMWDRVDAFEALAAGESMPGRCEWSVGYFPKLRLQDWQVEQQKRKESINSVAELKEQIYQAAEKKLKETTKDESSEVEQLKRQDFEEAETDMVTAAAPDDKYPGGILSVHIHQIVGLELESLRKPRDDKEQDAYEDAEDNEDNLPSSYCTIIVNHAKIYKTRTKPKNSKPFFNASTERFIRDWRSTSLLITVRDARLHENDALIGVIALPLGEMFRDKGTSRFNEFFPISGGVGYGRARVSVVFRSISLQPSVEKLGWDYGTLCIKPEVRGTENLDSSLKNCRLKFGTKIDKGKMHATSSSPEDKPNDHGLWAHGRRLRRSLRLAVRKRYSSRLLIEFRTSSAGLLAGSKTYAYAVLWLSDIPDCEKKEITLPVYSLSKDKGLIGRASQNVLPEDQRGEKIGAIILNIRFERGLGDRHRKMAQRNMDVGNVMEVLDVIRDNDLSPGCLNGIQDRRKASQGGQASGVGFKDVSAESDEDDAQANGSTNDGNISSDDDDDSDDSSSDYGTDGSDEYEEQEGNTTKTPNESNDDSKDEQTRANDGTVGGMMASLKGYKRHKEQLHRRQRGLMQWKVPRTAKWVKDRASNMVDKVGQSFEHQERQPGIETEV